MTWERAILQLFTFMDSVIVLMIVLAAYRLREMEQGNA